MINLLNDIAIIRCTCGCIHFALIVAITKLTCAICTEEKTGAFNNCMNCATTFCTDCTIDIMVKMKSNLKEIKNENNDNRTEKRRN